MDGWFARVRDIVGTGRRLNTYEIPIELLIFGDFMACEIFDAVPRSDGVSYQCRPDDFIGSIAAKMACEIERNRPENVVVFAGNQDAIMGMQPEEYDFHIAMMGQIAQSLKVPLTLVVPLPCGDPTVEQRLIAYRRLLRKVERQEKIQLLDLYEIEIEELEDNCGEKVTKRQFMRLYYEDKIHLNKDAKEAMCQRVYEYFWGV